MRLASVNFGLGFGSGDVGFWRLSARIWNIVEFEKCEKGLELKLYNIPKMLTALNWVKFVTSQGYTNPRPKACRKKLKNPLSDQ